MKQNFSRAQTECLKGVFALGIVICYLCSRTGLGSSVGLGLIYTALGYWGVSVFSIYYWFWTYDALHVSSGEVFCRLFKE